MEIRLQRVDDLMKKTFGKNVELLDFYGPVQMCVFGLTYKYIPTGEKIVFECERGVITVTLVDLEGKNFFPRDYFEESKYYHYEDKLEDLQDLVNSMRKLLELKGGLE